MDPAPVWVVAGAPGSGKTTVAAAVLRHARPVPARLDKDVLFAGLAGELLAAYGRPHGEREGPWYDAHVKVHEYAAMTAAARSIRGADGGAGCPVLLDAPFTTQIRDPARWQAWVSELGGDPVRLLWVRTGPDLLRERLRERGRPADRGKLDDFAAFVARMRPDVPPPVPHREVDNRRGAPDLDEQVRRLVVSEEH